MIKERFECAIDVFGAIDADYRNSCANCACYFWETFWGSLSPSKKNEIRCFPDSQEIIEEKNAENNKFIAYEFVERYGVLRCPVDSDFEKLALDEYERPIINYRNLAEIVDIIYNSIASGVVILFGQIRKIWEDEPDKITMLLHLAEKVAERYGDEKSIPEMLEMIKDRIENEN